MRSWPSTVDVGDVFMEVNHEYPDITIHLTLCHCTIGEGEPQLLEHIVQIVEEALAAV